jgi:23S rRNA (uracil1939-C5)-methyltransferase
MLRGRVGRAHTMTEDAAAADAPELLAQEWTILRLVPGGDGLTRLSDGRIAFASGALPGDRIRPLAIEDRKSYVRATRWQLIEPGPDRVQPACPVADRCGGCDWMALSRSAELHNKARVLREALVRTGGFSELPVELSLVELGPELGYRNRLRLHVDAAGRIGLFSRASHELVEIPGCTVSEPEINLTLERLRAVGKRHPRALAALNEIEIRIAPAGARVAIRLHADERTDGRVLEPLVAELSEGAAVSVAGHGEAAHEQRFPLPGGLELSAGPSAFTQVNWAVNHALITAVVDGARARGARSFLDLYAGAGNFSLPLLAAGLSGVAIEQTAEAIRSAEQSAREQGLGGGTFLVGDVGARVRRLAQLRRRFDLILLDPPRSGARDVLPWVIELRPAAIAICSCDPVTLARDLKTLARAGWTLESVTGFDMFPRTHHVEALAWMSSRPLGVSAP